jgi:uncharacterized protein YjbI with pentapeptide repeats
LTGLVKRRAELAGEIEATHERLPRMIEELEKLDSVILQFDPSLCNADLVGARLDGANLFKAVLMAPTSPELSCMEPNS